jgi:nucleotide-binding universal stress UspA family protein
MPAAAGLAAATGAAVLTLEVAAHDGLPGWSEAREHTVVTDRDPARAIVAYAAAVDAGAVAMATRARTGPSRAIAGSIALQVARHAPCPVLLVHIEEVRP